jgi:O-succinylhomoserine sulfhydrylase
VPHLPKRKPEISIVVIVTRTLTSLWIKFARWRGATAGFAFASGMAAVYSTMAALLKSGDHIVSSSSVFGATHSLFINYFPKWNIETSYFDINKPETIESFITPNTKILLRNRLQSSSRYYRLGIAGEIAKKHNLILIIDNCFCALFAATYEMGAHLVVHLLQS